MSTATPFNFDDIPSFEQHIFLEDSNTTAGVAVKDAPLGKDSARRKPLEEDEEGKKENSDIENLDEDLNIPNLESGKGRARGHMPQIICFEDFLKDLASSGIGISFGEKKPEDLKPTQRNFNEKKVDAIIASGSGFKPIITSKDGYIVDGHHRWLAAAKLNRPIAVKEVAMECEELLTFLRGKPYVERHTIDEGVLEPSYLIGAMKSMLHESLEGRYSI